MKGRAIARTLLGLGAGVGLLVASFVACSTYSGTESTAALADAAEGAEASVASEGGAPPPAEAGIDDEGTTESDALADAGTPDACSGTRVAPAKPTYDVSGPAGVVCGAGLATDLDGQYTGLDGDLDKPQDFLDSKAVGGCIAAEFATAPTTVAITGASSTKACSSVCSDSTALGQSCGTGRWLVVFSGASKAQAQWVRTLTLTPTAAEYIVPIPSGVAGKTIILCRGGARTRDDVRVDAISSCP